MGKAIVVIDYQNIHLTAHEQFAPNGTAKHESLVHPLHLANQILKARSVARAAKGLEAEALDLARVVVFRGLPGNRQQPDFYRRNQAQKSEWTRDRRVEVNYRPLKYTYDHTGHWTAQEKGVDVRVAIEVVKSVDSEDYDVVILAAHDTDLEPALEYALETDAVAQGRVAIETAGWANCKRLVIPGRPAWHTFLSGACFVNSRDRKDYK
ncbi:hypothetical protein GCM10027080_29130 [Pedococcus soli]